jgi:hypothetical protein
MIYTVYRITNRINGKIYVGKHQTTDLNDGYMGSGKHLKRSIAKYGIDNFSKEFLFVFECPHEMDAKEAEIVNEEFCKRKDTYNICVGGQGGFSYINENGLYGFSDKEHARKCANILNSEYAEIADRNRKLHFKKLKTDPEYRNTYSKKVSEARQAYLAKRGGRGHPHTEDSKKKIGEANAKRMIGSGNSQYGTMWITNGVVSKKIKKCDPIPSGWTKGRKMKTQ